MEWYVDEILAPEAFQPHKDNDTTGISLARLEFKRIEEIAKGPSKRGYYVAKLYVRDVRQVGLSVEYRPDVPWGHDDSHVEIPELNAGVRELNQAFEAQEALAKMVFDVVGPFPPPTS